jgi:hypothetical protein
MAPEVRRPLPSEYGFFSIFRKLICRVFVVVGEATVHEGLFSGMNPGAGSNEIAERRVAGEDRVSSGGESPSVFLVQDPRREVISKPRARSRAVLPLQGLSLFTRR